MQGHHIGMVKHFHCLYFICVMLCTSFTVKRPVGSIMEYIYQEDCHVIDHGFLPCRLQMEKHSVCCVLNTILGPKLCTIIYKTTPCHSNHYRHVTWHRNLNWPKIWVGPTMLKIKVPWSGKLLFAWRHLSYRLAFIVVVFFFKHS